MGEGRLHQVVCTELGDKTRQMVLEELRER